jgi:hypothetical protein
MCGKRYVVNALTPVGMDPNEPCPSLIGKRLAPLSPRLAKRLVKTDPDLEAQGKKMKSILEANSSSDLLTNFSWGTTTASISPRKSGPAQMSSDAALGAVRPILNP